MDHNALYNVSDLHTLNLDLWGCCV